MAEGKRERFMDVAERLFAERGLSFSMEDVVREAGASKRTLYEVFPSKEALVGALVERAVEEIEAGHARIVAEPGLSSEERVRRILAESSRERRRGMNVRLREIERAYPHLYRRLAEWTAEGWDRLAAFVEEGAHEGRFRKVDPVVLEILLAGFHRELAARGFQVEGRSLEAVLAGMADIVLHGVASER